MDLIITSSMVENACWFVPLDIMKKLVLLLILVLLVLVVPPVRLVPVIV